MPSMTLSGSVQHQLGLCGLSGPLSAVTSTACPLQDTPSLGQAAGTLILTLLITRNQRRCSDLPGGQTGPLHYVPFPVP